MIFIFTLLSIRFVPNSLLVKLSTTFLIEWGNTSDRTPDTCYGSKVCLPLLKGLSFD